MNYLHYILDRSEYLVYYSKKLLFNSCVFRSLQLQPKEFRRASLRQESWPPVRRLCMWAGMSLLSQTASLKSTSSGRLGKVSSTLTPLTGGSIRSQVKKKKEENVPEESVIVVRGAKPPRGVRLIYEVTSKGRVLLTYGQVPLIHANRRAHTGSNKPQQQITSEIIYSWLWYALCVGFLHQY